VPTRHYTDRAIDDLHRLRDFLANDDPRSAEATARIIVDGLKVLEAHPLIGRPVDGGMHELTISRGRSGYVALYEFDPRADSVTIVAIRHQREVGFEE
jgi:plasmid stabilization system protein ParE